MACVHVSIQGEITGVGYRSWTKQNALKLKLEGWVRNVDSHTVEAVFQGNKESVIKMIALCKIGPEIAWVRKVDVNWGKEIKTVTGFEIL